MPTLLCIHGWPMTGAVFSVMAAELTEATVVAPDLPGFGQTPDKGFQHSLTNYAEYICDLAVALPKPVHLVGLSMGGKLALAAAAARPECFQSIILFAPSYPDAFFISPETTLEQLSAYANESALREMVCGWAINPEPIVSWALASSFGAYSWWLTDGRLEDITAAAAGINLPTLVIHGESDPLRTAELLNTTIVDRLENAVFVSIPGASHCIPLDNPDASANVVKAWLARHRG